MFVRRATIGTRATANLCTGISMSCGLFVFVVTATAAAVAAVAAIAAIAVR